MLYWAKERMKEKRLLFYQSIKELDAKQSIHYYLKYQLAPILMGSKPSITLTINKEGKQGVCKEEMFRAVQVLELCVLVLRETPKAIIFLIYEKSLMQQVLENEQVRELLQSIHYDLTSIETTMECLVKRYKYCHCPHELGIFLGFDLEDVKDYMQSNMKKCLLCGYWKVYNDVKKAKETFAKYDQAKCTMLEELLGELSVKIKCVE